MNDIEGLKSELLSDSGLIAVSTGKGEIRIEGQMTHLATALVAGTVLGFSLSLIGEENEISASLIAECLLCGLSAYRDMKEIDVTGKAFEVFKEFLEGMEKT